MERAVGFVHINDQKQVSEVWAFVDKKLTYPDGSSQIKVLPASYRYEIEKVLQRYNILEMKDEDERTALLNNIRRGNLAVATAERSDGIHLKVLISAHPLARAVQIHDAATGQKLNRNEFLVLAHEREQSQSRGKSDAPAEMEAPDFPEPAKRKKQSR